MKKISTLIFVSLLFITGFSQSNYLLVGTYTSGTSKGIYVYRFNSTTGDIDSVSMVEISNPSFLDISPDQKFVYAVQENGKNGNGGKIAAFSFNKKKGDLTF